MWWDNKLMRTFRCRLKQKPGILGHLLASLGDEKGFLGEIKTVRMGSASVVRDLVVFADDQTHMEELINVVHRNPDAELLEVRDEVLEMHQGGKIACLFKIITRIRSGIKFPNVQKSAKRVKIG